jgi:hypothetical protein
MRNGCNFIGSLTNDRLGQHEDALFKTGQGFDVLAN